MNEWRMSFSTNRSSAYGWWSDAHAVCRCWASHVCLLCVWHLANCLGGCIRQSTVFLLKYEIKIKWKQTKNEFFCYILVNESTVWFHSRFVCFVFDLECPDTATCSVERKNTGFDNRMKGSQGLEYFEKILTAITSKETILIKPFTTLHEVQGSWKKPTLAIWNSSSHLSASSGVLVWKT